MTDEVKKEYTIEKKRNYPPNFWLEDSDFIKKSRVSDKYYFETLCYHIASFLKNEPIPILSTYDPDHNAIYLSIGEDKKYFTIDYNISYYDMVTLMRNWTSKYYPRYEITYLDQIELTEEEIKSVMKAEKISLMEAFDRRKVIEKKEIGVIDKVFFPDDEFILNLNGRRELRIAGGGIHSMMRVKDFMKHLRNLKDENEKRIFILDNSRFQKEVFESNKEISINYTGKMMIKFFEINFNSLKEKPFTPTEDRFVYKWGRFKIIFESPSLMNDCLSIYNRKKEKEA